MFQTEHEFTLPFGYLDDDGTLHREGTMRLATAADEILPLQDPRVQQNPAYLTVILLSRVVTPARRASSRSRRRSIEGLFAADLAYLQDLYNEINGVDGATSGHLPGVPARVRAGRERRWGNPGYPLDQLIEEVAFLAYHLHWPLAEIAEFEHGDRRRWVAGDLGDQRADERGCAEGRR